MKVLIWTKNTALVNMGGPMGYCYNIKSYLDEHPNDEIDFYPGSVCTDTLPKINESTFTFKQKFLSFLSRNRYFSFFRTLYQYYFKKIPLTNEEIELLKKYDFVHVHWASEILKTFSTFKINKTKVILTTHTPEPLFDELVGNCGMGSFIKKFPFIRDFFLKHEVNAYKKSDYVMFPVADATEPYAHKSQWHAEAIKEIQPKTFYVPTAINKLKGTTQNRQSLSKYNIPKDALKICYVGRHNEVKGYDILKQIAQRVWQDNPNIYFIIGGKESPLKGLDDNRWIELGWINTTELLNEIDAFILPNKETYFDIILLEVLRQGVPVIITRTGGNKWFENKKVPGIFCYNYDDIDKGASLINNLLIEKKNGSFESLKDANLKFFDEYLYMPQYIKCYLEQLHRIHRD